MTLLATPDSAGLIAPVPWLTALCCPTALDPVYHLPHVARVDIPGRSSPWVAAFTPRLAVVHRGLAAGMSAPPAARVARFMAEIMTAQVPRIDEVTIGALRDWCRLPAPAKSVCPPPCGGLGLVCDDPPIVCPRCGGYGVGEDREDGYGWIGAALVDRRELARVLEHLPPGERVDLGADEAGEVWVCGTAYRVWALGLPPALGSAAPRFLDREAV